MAVKKCFFGIKTDRQVDGDRMNPTVMNKVLTEGGESVSVAACMQCGTCSGGCPNVDKMDLSPRNLVLMVQRGEWEKVLKSNTLWLCTSCHTCTSRCPRGVRPSEIIEAVKALAIQEGIENNSVKFNQIFVELIQKRGILFEPELMHKYGGIEAMLSQAKLGIKLALRGKLSPFPAQVKNSQKFSQALEKAVKS
ncbi:putative heterodisulfide reductase, C subunit [Gloeothece citriformis PCC 7424]|uniref:Putative heterodisulfide reductase, C subunit n=1 Tax=Gloeothece citriformis (strain PCC 7424) TaxID=65393 RepID=B7KB25_GLOC7|nr:4Fe-4S dicluster domain-containing protein [Gloeothece citriformis]ACK70135.1 putative heterodisulfide reductase, C subunit [Gloeothece citriformis PCC 7424]